jgi:hypothetical protein
VTQGEGPEFKHQSWGKKKKTSVELPYSFSGLEVCFFLCKVGFIRKERPQLEKCSGAWKLVATSGLEV